LLETSLQKLETCRMPRISRLERDQVDATTQNIYDHYLHERGNVPNMFRTVAHRPEILRTLIAHFRAVMETGTLPAKLKELVIVRTSQINRCEY
jgi:alkylhydroperoxidase family enzyme